jgi:hypothetical protein
LDLLEVIAEVFLALDDWSPKGNLIVVSWKN